MSWKILSSVELSWTAWLGCLFGFLTIQATPLTLIIALRDIFTDPSVKCLLFSSTETQAHPHRPEELCVPHLRQTLQGGRWAPAPPEGPHRRETLPVPALPYTLCRAQHTTPTHQTQTPLPPSSHGNAEWEKRRRPRKHGKRIRSAGGRGERGMVQLHCV